MSYDENRISDIIDGGLKHQEEAINNDAMQLVVGNFYRVNIIGVGWLIAECGYHKYDHSKEVPCLLIDDREVYEDDYCEIELAF